MTPFEIGPIRPPSEARSLLLRVTRNCPHNRCAFCPVYRGARFSIRPLAEVLADVAAMGQVAQQLRERDRSLPLGPLRQAARGAGEPRSSAERSAQNVTGHDAEVVWDAATQQLATFLAAGARHVFLQDANSLVMRPEQLVQVLDALRRTFPSVQRITSYARAHTLTRRNPQQLVQLRQHGLDRVHVGLESGSDAVLALVHKGVDGARQIEAGQRVRAAGMELSEYVMPGLGGRALSREHALDSARVLSAIDPHFIRLRTTAFLPGTELWQLAQDRLIEPMDDEEVVQEIRLFIERLQVHSTLQSDHVLNLLVELEGELPRDRDRMLGIIHRFQSLEPRLRRAFIVGRRAGLVTRLDQIEQPEVQRRALDLLATVEAEFGDDLGAVVRQMMTRFV